MAALMEFATSVEHEEVYEEAPEQWLCGAIGLALRRAMPDDVDDFDEQDGLTPVLPSCSRPSYAFWRRARHNFRDDESEVSAVTDADVVFSEFTASTPPRVPVPPALPRPDSAASSSVKNPRKAFYIRSESIIQASDPDLVLGEP